MIFLSPGVKTREVDYSTYVGQISTCIVGLVGGAKRGPVGVPTLVTSPANFVEVFGEPIATDYGALAALEFLQQGNQLYYVRMMEDTAKPAEAHLSNDLIIVRAKEVGTYHEKISVALSVLSEKDVRFDIYKDSLLEETIEGSIDPTAANFIENLSSAWVEFIFNDETEIQPVIQSVVDFKQNTSNVWQHNCLGTDTEITSVEFTTNIPVSVTNLTCVSDSQGKLTVGDTIGNVVVSGTTVLLEFPVGTFDLAGVETIQVDDGTGTGTMVDVSGTPWTKEFEVTLIAANGITSKEVFKIEALDSAVSTDTVIEGTGTVVEGPTTIVSEDAIVEPTTSPVQLTGGNDGCPLTWQTVIGSGTTGLQAFRNTDELDINLIAAPGFWQDAVVAELISIAEGRADTLAIIDTPQGLSPQEALAYHNGTLDGEFYPKKALDSSYAAIFYPWVKTYDIYSKEYRWVPPSGSVLAAIAYNDNVGQPWFAPAGLNRGMLNNVLDKELSLDEGFRDALYGNGNVINSIINYKKQGNVIWGQRTAQRKTSATDRINVRRLLNLVRKSIAATTAYMVFEQNDPLTWRQWVGTVEPYLESIKSSRGLYDYKVQMDETTVTAYHQDRNEMPGKVWLQPTKTAEFIQIDFILTSTGASFTE